MAGTIYMCLVDFDPIAVTYRFYLVQGETVDTYMWSDFVAQSEFNDDSYSLFYKDSENPDTDITVHSSEIFYWSYGGTIWKLVKSTITVAEDASLDQRHINVVTPGYTLPTPALNAITMQEMPPPLEIDHVYPTAVIASSGYKFRLFLKNSDYWKNKTIVIKAIKDSVEVTSTCGWVTDDPDYGDYIFGTFLFPSMDFGLWDLHVSYIVRNDTLTGAIETIKPEIGEWGTEDDFPFNCRFAGVMNSSYAANIDNGFYVGPALYEFHYTMGATMSWINENEWVLTKTDRETNDDSGTLTKANLIYVNEETGEVSLLTELLPNLDDYLPGGGYVSFYVLDLYTFSKNDIWIGGILYSSTEGEFSGVWHWDGSTLTETSSWLAPMMFRKLSQVSANYGIAYVEGPGVGGYDKLQIYEWNGSSWNLIWEWQNSYGNYKEVSFLDSKGANSSYVITYYLGVHDVYKIVSGALVYHSTLPSALLVSGEILDMCIINDNDIYVLSRKGLAHWGGASWVIDFSFSVNTYIFEHICAYDTNNVFLIPCNRPNNDLFAPQGVWRGSFGNWTMISGGTYFPWTEMGQAGYYRPSSRGFYSQYIDIEKDIICLPYLYGHSWRKFKLNDMSDFSVYSIAKSIFCKDSSGTWTKETYTPGHCSYALQINIGGEKDKIIVTQGSSLDDAWFNLRGPRLAVEKDAKTDFWEYDTTTKEWAELPPSPKGIGANGLLITDENIYKVGCVFGVREDSYDPPEYDSYLIAPQGMIRTIDKNHLWALSKRGLEYSSDEGDNWTIVTQYNPPFVADSTTAEYNMTLILEPTVNGYAWYVSVTGDLKRAHGPSRTIELIDLSKHKKEIGIQSERYTWQDIHVIPDGVSNDKIFLVGNNVVGGASPSKFVLMYSFDGWATVYEYNWNITVSFSSASCMDVIVENGKYYVFVMCNRLGSGYRVYPFRFEIDPSTSPPTVTKTEWSYFSAVYTGEVFNICAKSSTEAWVFGNTGIPYHLDPSDGLWHTRSATGYRLGAGKNCSRLEDDIYWVSTTGAYPDHYTLIIKYNTITKTAQIVHQENRQSNTGFPHREDEPWIFSVRMLDANCGFAYNYWKWDGVSWHRDDTMGTTSDNLGVLAFNRESQEYTRLSDYPLGTYGQTWTLGEGVQINELELMVICHHTNIGKGYSFLRYDIDLDEWEILPVDTFGDLWAQSRIYQATNFDLAYEPNSEMGPILIFTGDGVAGYPGSGYYSVNFVMTYLIAKNSWVYLNIKPNLYGLPYKTGGAIGYNGEKSLFVGGYLQESSSITSESRVVWNCEILPIFWFYEQAITGHTIVGIENKTMDVSYMVGTQHDQYYIRIWGWDKNSEQWVTLKSIWYNEIHPDATKIRANCMDLVGNKIYIGGMVDLTPAYPDPDLSMILVYDISSDSFEIEMLVNNPPEGVQGISVGTDGIGWACDGQNWYSEGIIYKRSSSGTWGAVFTGDYFDFYGIYANNENDVWACGVSTFFPLDRHVVHWDGSTWEWSSVVPSQRIINDIRGFGNNVWVISRYLSGWSTENEGLWRWDGTEWVDKTIPGVQTRSTASPQFTETYCSLDVVSDSLVRVGWERISDPNYFAEPLKTKIYSTINNGNTWQNEPIEQPYDTYPMYATRKIHSLDKNRGRSVVSGAIILRTYLEIIEQLGMLKEGITVGMLGG